MIMDFCPKMVPQNQRRGPPFSLLFRTCSAGGGGSLAHFGTLSVPSICFGFLFDSILASKTFPFGLESVKHRQTTADTPRQTNSSFLRSKRNLAVGNFDKTTKTKTTDQQWGNGDAGNDNDGAHPIPAPPTGTNGVGGIAQHKQFNFHALGVGEMAEPFHVSSVILFLVT